MSCTLSADQEERKRAYPLAYSYIRDNPPGDTPLDKYIDSVLSDHGPTPHLTHYIVKELLRDHGYAINHKHNTLHKSHFNPRTFITTKDNIKRTPFARQILIKPDQSADVYGIEPRHGMLLYEYFSNFDGADLNDVIGYLIYNGWEVWEPVL